MDTTGIQQTLENQIATVDADVCHNMAVACSLGDELHTCSVQSGMPTEIAGCMVKCNSTAGIIGRLVGPCMF